MRRGSMRKSWGRGGGEGRSTEEKELRGEGGGEIREKKEGGGQRT